MNTAAKKCGIFCHYYVNRCRCFSQWKRHVRTWSEMFFVCRGVKDAYDGWNRQAGHPAHDWPNARCRCIVGAICIAPVHDWGTFVLQGNSSSKSCTAVGTCFKKIIQQKQRPPFCNLLRGKEWFSCQAQPRIQRAWLRSCHGQKNWCPVISPDVLGTDSSVSPVAGYRFRWCEWKPK